MKISRRRSTRRSRASFKRSGTVQASFKRAKTKNNIIKNAGCFLKKLFSGIGAFFAGLFSAISAFFAGIVKKAAALSKKTKIITAAAGGAVVLAVALTLIFTLGGSKPVSMDEPADIANLTVGNIEPLNDLVTLSDTQKNAMIGKVEERPDDPPQETYQLGDDHSEVRKIQSRLMELGYLGEDEPTYEFGETTQQAVISFQKSCGFKSDGIVDKGTYVKLFSEDAPEYYVGTGSEGTDVQQLQERLVELGFIQKATGYFGSETQEGVIRFQNKNGLTPDGKIGKESREVLFSDDVKANVLGSGDSGTLVTKYQTKLQTLGYFFGTVDGKYGSAMIEAVKLFQQQNGLDADGYLGAKTREVLDSSAVGAYVLEVGSTGTMVTKVQQSLRNLGYLSAGATGYFGDSTLAAVKNFQSKNGLSADGKVGAGTLRVLFSSSAKNVNGTTGSVSSGINRFINVAMSKLGSRYVLGAKGPSRFDCSGFVYWCLNQSGINQGYMTSYYWQRTTRYKRITSMSQLRRGDVISYKGHVAICAGNGYMIDASSSNGKVVYRSYQSAYWRRVFVCGYRIFG